MTPKGLAIRQLKADALRAGAIGVLIVRDTDNPRLIFEADGKPYTLELEGKMIVVAVFVEADDGPAGVES